MKPNSFSSHLVLSLLCSAFLSASAQAQPAYIELISPDNRADGRFGRHTSAGLPDLTRDGVGEFYVLQQNPNVVHVYNGSNLERLYAIAPAAGRFGFASTDSAGDLNGDGIPEIMIALEAPDGIGQVMAADGKTGANLFTIKSPNPVGFGYFGWKVRLLPDMNGDGQQDWLIHQHEYNSKVGRAYIFDSQTRKVIRLIQNRDPGFTFWMESVEVVPDVNSDGKPELAVVSTAASVVRDGRTIALAGRVVLRSLETGAVLYELHDPEPANPGAFGIVVAGIGDMTGDAVGDIAVMAGFKEEAAGVVYLFSGADGHWLRTLRSPNPAPRQYFGRGIIPLPDLNGDGTPELLLQENVKVAHLYDGTSSALLKTLENPGPTDLLFHIGTVQQTATPLLRAFVFASPSAADFEGRVYFMPFTPLPKPPQLKSLGVSNTGFRIQVIGDTGSKVEVQSTGDFKTWETVSSVTLGNQAVEVEDSTAASRAYRFYRAVSSQ